MLALIYLGLAIHLGDILCRRFFRFLSVPHRWAAAVLVGLLVSSWFTYLASLAFAWVSLPLVAGNLLFAAAVVVLQIWLGRKGGAGDSDTAPLYVPRPKGSNVADWLLIAGYLVLVSWMMFASFSSNDGKLRISNPEYSDFGPSTAIMQSFAVGHNFPTEYPHFSGDRIRYHFLFYFQAGNLEFLGLDPAWSLNLLSIITIVAMLILVTTLGEVLFESRAVGRLGSLLFFFFGSLSYVPFLQKQISAREAIRTILHLREFLPTIFPYRGEAWGTWSQVTYLNQRHFASAIGLLLLVLIFLAIEYRAFYARRAAAEQWASGPGVCVRAAAETGSDVGGPAENSAMLRSTAVIKAEPEPQQPSVTVVQSRRGNLPGFVFSGLLLGLLPMWNSAVFVAALAVLAVLFAVCPLRLQMIALALPAGIAALPQMLYLSTGAGRAQMPKLLHWGYTLDNPTAWNVAKYLSFTFGFKLLPIALALALGTRLQRRFFLAITSLIAVAFSFQFTIEVLANQKFIHVWAVIANLFVAYGLWRLWKFCVFGTTIPGKLVAASLIAAIIPGGLIEFFPVHNTYWSEVVYKNDPLIDWLKKNTTPRDIFLTDRFVTHSILMAGRRVFYGWPYYAWSAGYDASQRDRVYLELFQTRDPKKAFRLLKENGIRYVAFDNAVRQAQFIKRPNEQLFAAYFPKIYEAPNYNGMVIYKVPDTPPPTLSVLPQHAPNMFDGGNGSGNGEFDSPTAMALDHNGNVLIADTGNGRIQTFSPTGAFLASIGPFDAPNGVAVDREGNIYVAEIGVRHCVQKLTPEGKFIAEWKGSAPGFYGPRRITISPDDSIYVVNSGHNQVVKFNPDGRVLTTWGSEGSGDGQFNGLSSVAVDPVDDKLYVADPLNRRIQVFDSNGKFLTKWPVPEWGQTLGFEDLVVDSQRGRLYASSAHMNLVLVFDLNGARIGSLTPKPPEKLDGPSALALVNRRLYVLNSAGNHVSIIDL